MVNDIKNTVVILFYPLKTKSGFEEFVKIVNNVAIDIMAIIIIIIFYSFLRGQ